MRGDKINLARLERTVCKYAEFGEFPGYAANVAALIRVVRAARDVCPDGDCEPMFDMPELRRALDAFEFEP